MAIGRQGNSYAINSGNLPFTAPKKTNTKARDTFNKKKIEPVQPKAPAIVEVKEIEAPEITSEAQNITIQTEIPKEIEAPVEQITKEESIPEQNDVLEQDTSLLTDASTEIKQDIPESSEITQPVSVAPAPIQPQDRNFKNSSSKLADYTGVRKNTTFAFCDNNDVSYIKIKANRLGMTYQDFLAEILLENIQIIKADSFDYTEQTYQNTKRGLKNPVNDRFALKEDFLVDVKQAAANVGMKRSAFVAMCVHKARIADPNPAWDL